eukprot:s6390_g1.t1
MFVVAVLALVLVLMLVPVLVALWVACGGGGWGIYAHRYDLVIIITVIIITFIIIIIIIMTIIIIIISIINAITRTKILSTTAMHHHHHRPCRCHHWGMPVHITAILALIISAAVFVMAYIPDDVVNKARKRVEDENALNLAEYEGGILNPVVLPWKEAKKKAAASGSERLNSWHGFLCRLAPDFGLDFHWPDVALELAWKSRNMDFCMPYLIQVLREYTDRVNALDKKTQKKEEEEEKQKSAPNDYGTDALGSEDALRRRITRRRRDGQRNWRGEDGFRSHIARAYRLRKPGVDERSGEYAANDGWSRSDGRGWHAGRWHAGEHDDDPQHGRLLRCGLRRVPA